MAVYLTAAAAAIYYALHIQIRIAFTLDIGAQNAIRFGAGLFDARLIYKRELALTDWRSLLRGIGQSRGQSMMMPMLRAALDVFHRAKFEGARLSVSLGTGDAAKTALWCGLIAAILRPLSQSGLLPAKIAPDFNRAQLRLSAGGMMYVSAGHIIIAALTLARQIVLGRIQHG